MRFCQWPAHAHWPAGARHHQWRRRRLGLAALWRGTLQKSSHRPQPTRPRPAGARSIDRGWKKRRGASRAPAAFTFPRASTTPAGAPGRPAGSSSSTSTEMEPRPYGWRGAEHMGRWRLRSSLAGWPEWRARGALDAVASAGAAAAGDADADDPGPSMQPAGRSGLLLASDLSGQSFQLLCSLAWRLPAHASRCMIASEIRVSWKGEKKGRPRQSPSLNESGEFGFFLGVRYPSLG